MEVGAKSLAPPRLSRARSIAYVGIIICSLILIYFLTVRGMRFFLVPSSSMEPTLMPSDHLLTMKEEEYRRGDVVVIEESEEESGYLVKRIVALQRDRVEIRGGAVFVNGRFLSEPYVQEPIYAGYELRPVTVPEGQVFLLGDNRNSSDDSATWTPLGSPVGKFYEMAKIVGSVRNIYLPPWRMQRVKSYPLDLFLNE